MEPLQPYRCSAEEALAALGADPQRGLSEAEALPYEAMAILAVVVLNALMGHIQESRAEQAVAALRRMAAARANVIRGGSRQSIAAAELVPGDILLIEEGDTIAADVRLIHSTILQTAEAALTGESLPVSKDIATSSRSPTTPLRGIAATRQSRARCFGCAS
jgi:P-type E1-E2 ATPase